MINPMNFELWQLWLTVHFSAGSGLRGLLHLRGQLLPAMLQNHLLQPRRHRLRQKPGRQSGVVAHQIDPTFKGGWGKCQIVEGNKNRSWLNLLKTSKDHRAFLCDFRIYWECAKANVRDDEGMGFIWFLWDASPNNGRYQHNGEIRGTFLTKYRSKGGDR